MHVLYICQYFRTPRSPGSSRAFEMARGLTRRGHRVSVITTDEAPPVHAAGWAYEELDGVRIHRYPVPYHNTMSYRRRIMAFFAFVDHAFRRGRRMRDVDLVFASSTPLTVAIPGIFLARRHRAPFVLEVRDLWPEIPIAVGALKTPVTKAAARGLERFAYRNAERIVALSPGMAAGVARAGYPAERVVSIPNGSDVRLFAAGRAGAEALRRRHPWLGEGPVVLYAGAIGAVNNVQYLVRIAAESLDRSPEMRFVIVGEGRDEASVRALAASLGVLDRNLFLLPTVSKEEITAWFALADMAVSFVIDLPEMWNNSANKVFDAFAAGTPVMINHGGWLADVLRDSGAGLVVPPDDAAAAAASLISALSSGDWSRAASSASRELGETEFRREALVERFASVLEAVASA